MSVNFNEIYISDIMPDDELAHHGILGQKWGVRRFQNKDGTLTDAGKKRYSADSKYNFAIDKDGKPYAKSTNDVLTLPSGREIHRNTHDYSEFAMWATASASTAALITMDVMPTIPVVLTPLGKAEMALAAASEVAWAGMAINSEIKNKKYTNERKNAEVDPKTGMHLKKDNDMSPEDDMKRVNALYNSFDAASKTNCALCTTAYDLRRRGYDVAAKPARWGYTPEDITKWYSGAKNVEVSNKTESGRFSQARLANNTVEELSKQGNARGNLLIGYSVGGGHSIVYEVNDGKVTFRDAQINATYTDAKKYIKNNPIDEISYIRLDNCKIKPDKIKEVVY